MHALSQSLFTNIPVFVVLGGLLIIAVIGYKNLRSEMREGFLMVNNHLENHDREIKSVKKEMKGVKKDLKTLKKQVDKISLDHFMLVRKLDQPHQR